MHVAKELGHQRHVQWACPGVVYTANQLLVFFNKNRRTADKLGEFFLTDGQDLTDDVEFAFLLLRFSGKQLQFGHIAYAQHDLVNNIVLITNGGPGQLQRFGATIAEIFIEFGNEQMRVELIVHDVLPDTRGHRGFDLGQNVRADISVRKNQFQDRLAGDLLGLEYFFQISRVLGMDGVAIHQSQNALRDVNQHCLYGGCLFSDGCDHGVKRIGHAVEPLGHGCDFIFGRQRDTCRQIPVFQARSGLTDCTDRAQNRVADSPHHEHRQRTANG